MSEHSKLHERETKESRDKAVALLNELWEKDKGTGVSGDNGKTYESRFRMALNDLVRCIDNERQW